MFDLRLIATIVVRANQHVQSIGFSRALPVGDPVESAREFDRWGVDEIVLVFAEPEQTDCRRLIASVSGAVAVPLTVAGGVRNLQDVGDYLTCGADKVALNRALMEHPDLLTSAADRYGVQCMVASVDLVRSGDECLRYDYWKSAPSSEAALPWMEQCVRQGAGEILLNFPEHDGAYQGMDTEAVRQAVETLSVPLIAVGGVGRASDVVACWQQAQPSAIGVGNLLAHIEHALPLIRNELRRAGARVREGVVTDYAAVPQDQRGRVLKQEDAVLEELIYRRVEPDTI